MILVSKIDVAHLLVILNYEVSKLIINLWIFKLLSIWPSLKFSGSINYLTINISYPKTMPFVLNIGKE